jgi:perosamine synthetase|tara:strand:+ start:276 stop:1436 length:1161 start_codon:yes stop_codon:yes gene_type:complete
MPNLIKYSTKYINQAVDNQFRTSKNRHFNNLLINEFCNKINVKYGVTVSSGTAGLHTTLLSLELKKNDEVIMPAITMSAVAYSILLSGAKPIFADIDENSLNIDPTSVEKRITKNTKAIICVSLYGLPPNYTALKKIIKSYKKKIYLIEDNAECVMGRYKKKIAGSFGDFSMFSFQSSKVLTCGEGGIIVTNDKRLWEKAKVYSNLGYYISKKTYRQTRINLQNTNFKRHKVLGYKYSLSDISAAIVYGQLKKINLLCKIRNDCGKEYKKIINKFSFIKTQEYSQSYKHGYWAFSLLFNNKKYYEFFKKKFRKNGGDFFYACWRLAYQEEFYKRLKIKYKKCEKAENIQQRLIQLKTNYSDRNELLNQCKALEKTLSQIKNKYKNV